MAFVIADRVRETTTTIGTGSVTLGGAYTSFQTFSAAIGNGNNTYYTIASASSGEWEVGIGTYTSGGNLLSRDTVLASSNAGNLVNFSVGSKDVFVTQPSERSLLINAASNGLFAGNAAFTANGIPYANSTTTLTTGSALTFDGTNLGVGGSVKIPQVYAIEGRNAANSGTAAWFGVAGRVDFGVGGDFAVIGSTSGVIFGNSATNAEQMRLTSTGLGIGTSSPGYKLTVAGKISYNGAIGEGADNTLSSSGTTLILGESSTWTALQLRTGGTVRATIDSSGNLGIGTSSPWARLSLAMSNGQMGLANGNTSGGVKIQAWNAAGNDDGYLAIEGYTKEYARFDASGNLGLGVTPSAWASNWKAFQIGSRSLAQTGSGAGDWTMAFNAVFDSTDSRWEYQYTGDSAVRYSQTGAGAHSWYTAPSGNAGDPITFTQAMTLDASGRLLIGTTSATASGGFLQIGQVPNGTSSSIGFNNNDNAVISARYSMVFQNDSDNNIGGRSFEWKKGGKGYSDGTSLMTLDASGNLGIGTSSPTDRLHVVGTASRFDKSNGVAVGQLRLLTTTDSYATAWALGQPASSTNFAVQYFNGSSWSDAAIVDTSGNLGLGVTPSAWGGSGVKAFDVGTGASFAGSGSDAGMIANAYYNGSNWIYKTSSLAVRYQQIIGTGTHAWYTAASGTAGNAITFTQAMTLDASGNLGVGETSPGSYSKFVVRGGSGNFISYFGASTQTILGDNAGDKGQVGTVSNHPFIFITNATERARILSGGEVLIAATALASYFDGKFNVAGRIHTKIGNAADSNHVVWNEATSGDNGFVIFGTEATYTIRGSIDYNRAGGLTRYNTTSDYRAKDIIGPVQNPGATIDALKVYEGVMKGATQSRPMLVAHEAQEHAPYAVSGVKDEVNEDGTPKFQQIDVSSLVPLLLAEIQSLRARVAQLESKGA